MSKHTIKTSLEINFLPSGQEDNECAECGTPFPLLNLLAFKLHASHTAAPIPEGKTK